MPVQAKRSLYQSTTQYGHASMTHSCRFAACAAIMTMMVMIVTVSVHNQPCPDVAYSKQVQPSLLIDADMPYITCRTQLLMSAASAVVCLTAAPSGYRHSYRFCRQRCRCVNTCLVRCFLLNAHMGALHMLQLSLVAYYMMLHRMESNLTSGMPTYATAVACTAVACNCACGVSSQVLYTMTSQ